MKYLQVPHNYCIKFIVQVTKTVGLIFPEVNLPGLMSICAMLVQVEYYSSVNKVSANGDFSGQLAIRQNDFHPKSSGVLHKRTSPT